MPDLGAGAPLLVAQGPDEDRSRLGAAARTLFVLPYGTWNFGVSVAFDAMLAASAVLEDPGLARFAHGWARSWASQAQPFERLDCTAPGRAMVEICRRFDDGRLLATLVQLAEYLMARPQIEGVYATWERSPLVQPYGPEPLDARGAALAAQPPPGVFVDCLHFDPPFLTALGVLTGQDRYVRAGVDQACGYVRLLQKASGLFDHFVLEGEPGSFGPGWGRGQGWALLGLVDVLDICAGQEDGPERAAALAYLRSSAARLISAMVGCQRDDGHWYAVVDNPASGDEYSTAAFMASGFWRASHQGTVAAEEVGQSVARARHAVRDGLAPDGVLRNVSAAVMASTLPAHYAHVPTGFFVPWGQGPAVLALTLTADVS